MPAWSGRTVIPPQVLPSLYCSLVAGFRAIWEDNTDPKDVSARQLELWARGAEKALECRRQMDPAQFYDLHFVDFMADPACDSEYLQLL